MNGFITGSTVVRNVVSETPDNTTLILSWQPPEPTNGDILSYTVRISLDISNNIIIIGEWSVMPTSFTASSLSKPDHYSILFTTMMAVFLAVPGVPYDVSIIPMNLAGQGDFSTMTFFTLELSKSKVTCQFKI